MKNNIFAEKYDPLVMIIKGPTFTITLNKRYYDSLSEAKKKSFWKKVRAGVEPQDIKIEEI